MSRYSALATAPRGDIVVVEEDVTTLESKVAALETAVASGGGGVGVTQAELTAVANDVTAVANDVTAVTNTVALMASDVTSSIDANSSAITTLQATTTGHTSSIGTNSGAITTLQSTTTTNGTNISNLQSGSTTDAANLASLLQIVMQQPRMLIGAGGTQSHNAYAFDKDNNAITTFESGTSLSNLYADSTQDDTLGIPNFSTVAPITISYEFTASSPPLVDRYYLWPHSDAAGLVDHRDEMPYTWELHGATNKTAYEAGTYEKLHATDLGHPWQTLSEKKDRWAAIPQRELAYYGGTDFPQGNATFTTYPPFLNASGYTNAAGLIDNYIETTTDTGTRGVTWYAAGTWNQSTHPGLDLKFEFPVASVIVNYVRIWAFDLDAAGFYPHLKKFRLYGSNTAWSSTHHVTTGGTLLTPNGVFADGDYQTVPNKTNWINNNGKTTVRKASDFPDRSLKFTFTNTTAYRYYYIFADNSSCYFPGTGGRIAFREVSVGYDINSDSASENLHFAKEIKIAPRNYGYYALSIRSTNAASTLGIGEWALGGPLPPQTVVLNP